MSDTRKPALVSCPTCGTKVEWTPRARYRPFCSERCKLIDLGAWLDGSNSIPGPELDDESVAELNGDRDGAANDEA